DLLENLQRSEGFALILVTHNLELAARAKRTYEMRQGVLVTTSLSTVNVAAARQPRHFGPPEIRLCPELELEPPPRAPILLGSTLLRGAATALLRGAAILAGVVLLDFGVAKYQEMQVRARGERIARLADLALSSLRSDVQSVADFGD